MRSAKPVEMQYTFYSNIYDTPYITSKIEHNRQNLQEVNKLVAYLFEEGYPFKFADYKKFNNDVNDSSDGSSRAHQETPSLR